jgi:hypothetical protein
MPGLVLNNRVPQVTVKTITFDGVTFGDVGTDTVATVTGRVLITHLAAWVSTAVVTTTAGELELGTASNTAELIAQVLDAGDLTVNTFWTGTAVEANAAPAITDKTVASDIILTTSTSPMTSGVIEFSFRWIPLSTDGQLA